jgi:sialidase-1
MPRPTANWFAWVADFSFVAVVLAPLVGIGSLNAREQHVFVESGRPLAVTGSATDDMRQVDGALVLSGADNALFADLTLDQGDFHIQARLALPELVGSGASLLLEGNYHTPTTPAQGRHVVRFWLDGEDGQMHVEAEHTRMFRTKKKAIGKSADSLTPGRPFQLVAERRGGTFTLSVDGKPVFQTEADGRSKVGSFGFAPGDGEIRLYELQASGNFHPPQVEHVDVWTIGHDGYNSYRIPSMCTTAEGTVLAFAEARNPGREHGNVDVVMKRSTDGGATWSEQQLIWDPGDDVFFARDPSPVVDRETGHVHLIMGSNAPLGADAGKPGPRRLFVMCSADDGRTWSEPRPLDLMTQRDDMTMLTGGPCHGIQLTRPRYKGRLVVPGYCTVDGKRHGCLVYSNDHGQTWKLGGIAAPGTPESTVVELADGAVMLNMRRGPRSVAISQDGGETFPTTKRDPALPGPDCQATLCRYSWPDDAKRGGKSRILFCNPATQARGENGRRGMTVRLSYDEGKSWSIERMVYAGYSAYSAMTVLPDGRIGILYEKDGYRRLSFAAFTLDWLTRGKETLDK